MNWLVCCFYCNSITEELFYHVELGIRGVARRRQRGPGLNFKILKIWKLPRRKWPWKMFGEEMLNRASTSKHTTLRPLGMNEHCDWIMLCYESVKLFDNLLLYEMNEWNCLITLYFISILGEYSMSTHSIEILMYEGKRFYLWFSFNNRKHKDAVICFDQGPSFVNWV